MNAMQMLSRIALMLAFVLSAVGAQPVAAQATERCECVIYVQNRLNLARGTLGANAAGAGRYLIDLGYERVTGEPRPGDIVIMQFPKYATSSNGHIAILTQVALTGAKYKLHFDGTNQPGDTKSPEFRCNNVTNDSTSVDVNDPLVAYYRLRPAMPVPTHGSRIVITSVHSGLVVDVKGRSSSSGAVVQQWPANGGSNQEFVLARVSGDWYTLRAAHTSNMCLDVKARSTANGARVQLFRCHRESNQQFRFQPLANGQFMIIARHSNAALDVTNWSTGWGTALQMWQQHQNQNNQRWTIRFR